MLFVNLWYWMGFIGIPFSMSAEAIFAAVRDF